MESKACSTCKIEKPLSEYNRNKKHKDGRSYICKSCFADYQREYHKKNYDKLKQKRDKYRSNPEVKKRHNETCAKYQKNRRRNDPLFRVRMNIRNRTREAFAVSFWTKTSRTRDILGCSYDKAIAYAEELQSISKLDGYFAKVYIYEQMDEHSLAREYMKKGIKLRQDFSCLNSKHHSEHCKINSNDLRYYLALAYLSEKMELNTAAFLFEKYISDFSSADTVPLELAYFQLANLCLIQDNTEGALTHLNHALELNSDFDLAKNAKKHILMTMPD